jgi:predicted Zn-dependent peptidase
MKKSLLFAIMMLPMMVCAQTEALKVKSFRLDNGLTVWLNEDHTQSSVRGMVVVRAGAKDSPATGIAHYFEHIMFKGTDKIGTIDYASEKVYLDSIAAQYEFLASANDEVQRKNIQQKINQLSIAAAQYAIPNEFNNLISKMGGSGLNAGTSYDYTVYYNTFVPAYINQWLELNSERLLHPVFRLFQSELETVYEEKNRSDDNMMRAALNRVLKHSLEPHPYQYPVLGLAEHLKNPSLAKMEQFYNEYYKGGNMLLLLCGDFNAEEVMPVIREKFGRLAAGNAPERPQYDLPPFKKGDKKDFLLPIPIIKAAFMAWRGVNSSNPDKDKLTLAMSLLSNEGKTGYLNRLAANGKLMEANLSQTSLNDAGLLTGIVIPKLLFQSVDKAEKLVINEIERIKKGDFSESDLDQLKLELKRGYLTDLENISSRSQMMLDAFTQSQDWESVIKQIDDISNISKADIVEVANRYFNENYISFRKKKGRYSDEHVTKPAFAPIKSSNQNAQSDYAKELIKEAASNPLRQPKFIDFENDAQITAISPLVTLYTHANPINDVFNFKINYRKSVENDYMLSALDEYLDELSTDSIALNDFRTALQKIGSSMRFSASMANDYFSIIVTGFDQHFEETLQLVSHFITNVKADDKAFKKVLNNEKIDLKALNTDPEVVANALYEYALFDSQSIYLTMPQLKDYKKLGSAGFIHLFHDLTSIACDMHYSGNLSKQTIEQQVKKYLHPEKTTQKAYEPVYKAPKEYTKSIVYVVDFPKAKQSIITTFSPQKANYQAAYRDSSILFNTYFGGGGMSSILFQEIREFRSYAYAAYSQYIRPNIRQTDKKAYLKCFLSTQADKTFDAVNLLDSLIKNMPIKEDHFADTKQIIWNDVYNSYPNFRNVSERIANQKAAGFEKDSNAALLSFTTQADLNVLKQFYNDNIAQQPIVYTIVGDIKRIDMKQLEKIGEVKIVKMKEIIK